MPSFPEIGYSLISKEVTSDIGNEDILRRQLKMTAWEHFSTENRSPQGHKVKLLKHLSQMAEQTLQSLNLKKG